MNGKIKRIFSMILVACMLLSLVPLHAASLNEERDLLSNKLMVEDEISTDSNVEESDNTESTLSSEMGLSSSIISEEIISEIGSPLSSDNDEDAAEQQDILTKADEETEEPENDNWELGLVFYDSTVDNGKTPLTEIDWDASDGGYAEGIPRVITVQINYKNTNTVTTYQPGELKIRLNRLDSIISNDYLLGNTINERRTNWLSIKITIGANDSTHTGYNWNYINTNKDYFIFENNSIIEEHSNFEGSIQVVFTITPIEDKPELGKDECTHSLNRLFQANIDNKINSNPITLNYTRTSYHPWKYQEYEVIKTASKISSYDGLGQNASEYIWVKYVFYHTNFFTNPYYPSISASLGTGIYKDKIPEECVVYDESSNLLKSDENGYYSINAANNKEITTSIYVGYPKSIYNEENNNLTITNEVELWGTYNDKSESEILAKNDISINLADFKFVYTGDLYRINKNKGSVWTYKLRYQDIVNSYNNNKMLWKLRPIAIYSGHPMTLKIGDDLLYSTNLDGRVEKLKDNEYYFSKISFIASSFNNGNSIKIASNKYDCELYIRYENSNEYVKYEAFKNPINDKYWNFSQSDKVVGFYFMIHDMEESISASSSPIEATTVFTKKDIPESGKLYNFDYLQVYFKDSSGNLILQNEPDIESYANFLTKEEIATYDQDVYGVYLQRGVESSDWSYYNPKNVIASLYANKKFGNSIKQDISNEKFYGDFLIGSKFSVSTQDGFSSNYINDYDKEYAIKGFKIYDLLPTGMELTSTKEEIANSLTSHSNYRRIYKTDGTRIDTQRELNKLVNTTVNISENWNQTNRTKIEILVSFKEPLYFYGGENDTICFDYKCNYSISYDAFLEYGSVWKNYCYVDKLATQEKGVNINNKYTLDNGYYDLDAKDIDEDGSTINKLAYANAQTTITSAVSTHQDVQKQVKTDQSNYSTGTVKSSYDSEYEYKLRVKTGQNDVTNLVIYDSLEEYAQNPSGDIVPAYGTTNHWNGEFLGIDTSYAESKGYVVKPYYSENPLAGNLADDSSWIEYSDSVDKLKVKALAFEYLDADGKPAKLPANSLTYVLIKMKSPSDENITSLAYNGCRTQWQALDDYDRPVDFITGINSNIVKVSLPNSVEDKEVNLSFNKIIDATDEDFEKLKLDKESTYNFLISLTNQETGEVINGLLDSKEGFRVNNIPIGTYIIEEQNDIWFHFINMALMEPIEGIEFKEENGAYIITIGASVESGITAEIGVTNKLDEERFYDSKYDIKNLFTLTM